MRIEIKHERDSDSESLRVVSGLPSCGLASALVTSVELEVQAARLVRARKPVGDYSDHLLRIIQVTPSFFQGFKETVELERAEEGESLLYYKSLTFEGRDDGRGPGETWIVEGALRKETHPVGQAL